MKIIRGTASSRFRNAGCCVATRENVRRGHAIFQLSPRSKVRARDKSTHNAFDDARRRLFQLAEGLEGGHPVPFNYQARQPVHSARNTENIASSGLSRTRRTIDTSARGFDRADKEDGTSAMMKSSLREYYAMITRIDSYKYPESKIHG